ncbi:hypothetical protein EUU23_12235 [Sphingorhabdus sp. IMCC26285]|uniref:Oligosaccharide repeat unit polymerase n=1 Tax=Sphingorhabdus profundilacus TaxID=2509718 RepID=A0A6I4LYE0_9SPHN|nr:hypothetical protein [Sphingorhabdus profundilacus]MVZ98462.1 hypothetical protein [Sphingorhabdus profundilacus]
MMSGAKNINRDMTKLNSSAFSEAAFRFGASLIYAIVLCYAYEVLSLSWAYFGFTYRLTDNRLLYGACVIAAFPSVLLSTRPKTFAECTAWFLYILVYLPCLIVPVMQFSSDLDRLLQIFGTTFVGCVLFLVLSRGEVRRINIKPIPPQIFWGGLAAIWTISMVFIIYSFGQAIQFVSLDDIYTQRFAGAESAFTAVRYALALLASAIDPFLIAAGLYTRRYWLAGIGIFSQVFLFGTLAARAVLLSPIFVIGAYFLADKLGHMRANLFLIGLLIIIAVTAPFLANYDPIGGGVNNIVTLVYLRTLLISGAIFGVYEQFFALYPLTYYSNNNIISLFVQYPYGDLSVGQAVMLTLIPSAARDIGELNANFLATDGVAALGVAGVPVVSAASALILRLLSRFIQPERTMLMVAAGTGFILSMANTSILTSLITGGGILLIALVSFAPLRRD